MTHPAPDLGIGHVHLRVSDLESAIDFYREVIGLELTQRYGREAAFLSAGDYHHHIGLNTWDRRGGMAPPREHTGLYHAAFPYPDSNGIDLYHDRPEADWPRDGTGALVMGNAPLDVEALVRAGV